MDDVIRDWPSSDSLVRLLFDPNGDEDDQSIFVTSEGATSPFPWKQDVNN